MDKQEQLNNTRHSCAHLLAAAVMELWPDTKRTIGPAIENGFYYDFDFAKPISEADFPSIEKKMEELLKGWQGFEKEELTEAQAKERFADNPYKLELIDEISKDHEPITVYRSGSFEDLCRGGHSENPVKELKAFKLLSVAGAYWRGSEKNKMLTRIYGTCFESKKELEDHLQMLENAKKRDHRKIGQDLGLFVFSDLVGKGLPLLTPKGTTIRRELERFIVDEELRRGYQHVITPPLAKVDLYRTSGHYPYYKDTMYPPMVVDEEELILRPMTCPHHFMLYKSTPHSYRELPVRYAEISPQFRYEKSGELTGLMRVRMFTLADAHIICSSEQAKGEIAKVLDLIDFVNKTFGLEKGKDYRYRLSLGDRDEDKKYYKDDEAWDKAESVLRDVLTEVGAPFYEAKNEAAFYGPKIDVQMKNVMGKEETAFTVQYDFVQPKRFELRYVDEQGKEQEPVVIHRSSLGAFERVMAFLIEHFAGKFPLWISPVQTIVLPISDKTKDYGGQIAQKLTEAGLRAQLDEKDETLQAKIRNATMERIPYLVIVGPREQEADKIAVRTREGEDLGQMTVEQFIDKMRQEIEKKS